MNQREYKWQDWKALQLVHHALPQFEEMADGVIRVRFVDGTDEHLTTMYRGEVPHMIAAAGYDQAQNDSDLAEFDAVKGSFNLPQVQRDYDGRVKIQPVTLGTNQWHYWHSRGDTTTELRKGSWFKISNDGSGENGRVKVEWQYRDPVWMAGGRLTFRGAKLGDSVSLKVFAPATVATPNPTNTGNANIVFGYVIVPAAGDGAYDVNLSTAVPCPSTNESGYWSHELPADFRGAGTTNPSEPGKGKYHLLAIRFDLTEFVGCELMLGDGDSFYEPQNINASLCLPQWRFECTSYHSTEDGAHTVQLVWRVLVSRYWTTI